MKMNSLNNFLIREILSLLPNNDVASFISTCKKYDQIYSKEEKEEKKIRMLKEEYGLPGKIQVRNNDVFIIHEQENNRGPRQEIFLKNVDFRKYICETTIFEALSFNNLPIALKQFCDGMYQKIVFVDGDRLVANLITVDEDYEKRESFYLE